MRERFTWYLPPTEAETARIWAEGTLTLDANVLLDLYRYHERTRASLIQALNGFGDRTWISDQAAKEFFDNRKAVIAQADTTFKDADKAIKELATAVETALSRLRGYRLIPRDSLDEIGVEVKNQVQKASQKVTDTKSSHPDYLKDDPILQEILNIFDGKIGESPTPLKLEELHTEAARRQAEKIPPGYLDEKKEGIRAYGDYILWSQTLEHAKTSQKPTIIVTSEQKPDWWEEQSGRRVGPRPELLKEAFENTGQTILIYQTEHFLREAGARLSQLANNKNLPESVEEIRDVSSRQRQIDFNPAISVDHIPENSDFLDASGTIYVRLSRPVRNFTASVSLDSENDWTGADAKVATIKSPVDTSQTLLRVHIDHRHKLHVHCHASDKNDLLSVGDYYFSYDVSLLNLFLEQVESELSPTND